MSYTPHSTDRSGISQPNYRGFAAAEAAAAASQSSSQGRVDQNNMNVFQQAPQQQYNGYQSGAYAPSLELQQGAGAQFDYQQQQSHQPTGNTPVNYSQLGGGGMNLSDEGREAFEKKEKLEREKLISQIKSSQLKDKNTKQYEETEESLAIRLQYEMFEQQKQGMLQPQTKQQQQALPQQQQPIQHVQLQLLQQQNDAQSGQKQLQQPQHQQQSFTSPQQNSSMEENRRRQLELQQQQQQHHQLQQKQQQQPQQLHQQQQQKKEQEEFERRQQQQQYQQQQVPQDDGEDENIFQGNQQDLLMQRQREQEELLQRQYQEQQEQEEYYQQQLEMQHKQILEQQQLLDQMKKAMSHQSQQQQQSHHIPSKGISLNDPPESVKRSKQNKQYSSEKQTSMHTGADNNNNYEKRFEIIEKSLNRVCNQHDALMPLLQLLETVPALQRSEQQVKNLSKKYSDVEKKLKELETNEKKDTQYQHIFSNIDRNFKSTNQQVQQLKKQIIALEDSIGEVAAIPEEKLKEDTLNLYRQVDQKLDRNLRDVKSLLAEFKNQVSLQVKRGSQQNGSTNQLNAHGQLVVKPSPNRNRSEYDFGDDAANQSQYDLLSQTQQQQQQQLGLPIQAYHEMNAKMEQQMQQFNGQIAKHQRFLSSQSVAPKQQIDIDITNIYREIGMLRSEMELLFNQQRSQIISEQLQKITKPTQTEKQLFIAGLEQNLFLQEIECFDSLNQQRLQNELDLLEDKLYLISNDIQNIQGEHNIVDQDSDRVESASQHLLIEQYRSQDGQNLNQISHENKPLSNVDVLGYELKYIGDRLFNFRQQIHGTKKKYLCDCRRLEDRLQTLEYLQSKAKQEGTDNKAIQGICQIDSLRKRVDSINNSVGEHVASLLQKLADVDKAFAASKEVFKTTRQQLQQAH